jgi:hypothetical protein
MRLPVSGYEVDVRRPTGVEDLLLAEFPTPSWDLCMRVLSRLAPVRGSEPDDAYGGWDALPLTDADNAMLQLRRAVMGNVVRTDIKCAGRGCGQRIDLSFEIDGLLNNRMPRKPRTVESSDRPGWYRLGSLEFRAPSASDLAGLPTGAAGREALADSCIRPTGTRGMSLRRIEAALGQLAPSLSGDLAAVCPECGTAIHVYFSVHRFVLAELSAHARTIFSDVHVIASTYHWSESEILNLPEFRRNLYASMAREGVKTDS